MNDDNFSNIPVSELVKRVDPAKLQAELDKNNKKDSSKKSNTRLFLIIGGIILAIGIGVGLYFLLRKPAPENTDASEEVSDVVWEPDEDSTEPAQDFISDKQAIANDPDADTSDKVQAQIEIVNLYSVMEQFDEGLAILDSINREELAYSDLFSLYSAYSYLYEHSGDEAKKEEYDKKIDELFSTRWEDSDEQDGEDTGNE